MTDEQAERLIALAERIAVALEAEETRVPPRPPGPGRRLPPAFQAGVEALVEETLDERVKSDALKPKK